MVIDQNGTNLGKLKTFDAIKLAQEAGLELVEVSGGANPPVCRIMDYNKYLYEQKTKSKQTKAKKTEMKEFQLGPHTGDEDIRIRVERGRKFLQEGNVVKYTVKFRGRAKLFPELGATKLKIIESELADVSRVEKPATMLGNIMTMTLAPSGK